MIKLIPILAEIKVERPGGYNNVRFHRNNPLNTYILRLNVDGEYDILGTGSNSHFESKGFSLKQIKTAFDDGEWVKVP